jgi:phosphate transport system permease protein
MTDATAHGSRAIDVASNEARARIKARYRAEARFRFYGMAAIGIAAIFLVLLLTDIVTKAIPAFTIHSLTLNVPVVAETVDPGGKRDPADFAQAGDFTKVVRDALLAELPGLSDRSSRRVLNGLLSNGAADILRRRVVADPNLIGTTVSVPVLLSDEADLFYKGVVTSSLTSDGRGVASPSGTTGTITILSTSNAFSDDLIALKQVLRRLAQSAERDAGRAALALQSTEADLRVANERLAAAKASGDAARISSAEGTAAKLEADRQSLQGRIAELQKAVTDHARRYDAPGGVEALDTSLPSLLVRINGGIVKVTSVGNDRVEGEVLYPLESTNDAKAGTWQRVIYETPESNRKLSDREVAVLDTLAAKKLVANGINWLFFTSGDSREPELAGILGALVGSALTMAVTLVICLPLGVGAAIYLEEFAPKNRITAVIEVNINNLAAVPSIVFGLLGLAVFLNFFDMPRSAPLVGGLVLALLVLPTIIIASRAALKAVPPSIREAALGIGASKQQAIFHHVLPLAMPGILTGTIIGMAHALGESAPLLMIGMIAFIVDVPSSVTEAATVLPVQIFLWADLPEIAFQAKTAGAILVLLAFLFVMNGLAIVLRKKFERRW